MALSASAGSENCATTLFVCLALWQWKVMVIKTVWVSSETKMKYKEIFSLDVVQLWGMLSFLVFSHTDMLNQRESEAFKYLVKGAQKS